MGRISRLVIGLLIAAGGIGTQGFGAASAQPEEQTQACQSAEPGTETLAGATLNYASSFRCVGVAADGTFSIAVDVENAAGSVGPVTINDLVLTHATPKRRGQVADASVTAQGLPLTLDPGQSGTFTVAGAAALVEPGKSGKGGKANLHLQARGASATGDQPFQLGLNVQLRADATDAADDDGKDRKDGKRGGPPDWVSGPPPWADDRQARGR
ncbi:MAG: hypothetical protein H0W06_08700 [Chloroflexia bacterium]|nr:hypothetical protein [Chloroflexia bacterium]